MVFPCLLLLLLLPSYWGVWLLPWGGEEDTVLNANRLLFV